MVGQSPCLDHTMNMRATPPQHDSLHWQPKRTPKASLPRAFVAPFKLENSNAEQFEVLAASVGSLRARLRNVLDVGPAEVLPRRAPRRLSMQEKSRQLAKIREGRRTIHFLPTVEAQTPPVDSPLPNRASVAAGHPPNKKPKLVKGNEPMLAIKPQLLRRTLSKGSSAEGPLNKGSEDHEANVSTKPKPRLPTPITPMVLRRRTMMKAKSTEEQELEKIHHMQQEVVEQRKKNEESFKAAIAGAGEPPKKLIPGSKPVGDVHFQTDRLGRQSVSKANDSKEVDVTAVPRRSVSSPAPLPKGRKTVPKPFKLPKGNKRKLEEERESCDFVSTAQQVEAFFKRTPCRYHLRSRLEQIAGPSPVKWVKPRVTTPKTPHLETKRRHRPVTCKSTAEVEAEQLEYLQQYKFRARELDRRILEGPQILPKKQPVKELTKPVGFNFHLEKRIQEREVTGVETEVFTFHSRPCPTKILEGVVGVPERKCVLPTVPKSPGFALKYRVRPFPHDEQEVPVIKANPMPDFGAPFKPKAPEQKQTELIPFSFESRDKERIARTAKKLEDLRREEVPVFKASLLPYFDQVFLPEKRVKPVTQPEPFNLQIEERGAKKTQQWKQKIEEELKQQKEATCFKARPSTVLHQEPFVPKRDSRILSVHDDFELATEKRAKERQEFEKRMAELEAIKEKMEEEDRIRKEGQEKQELARMRKHDLVHKAQPVKKYKAVEVKTREMPVTVPKSPNFSDRFK
ncbi:targeting protein for Xklp2-B-like [Lissotriton helveticus]